MKHSLVRSLVTLVIGLLIGLIVGRALPRAQTRPDSQFAPTEDGVLKSGSMKTAAARRLKKASSDPESANIILGNILTVPFQELYSVLSSLPAEKLNSLAAQLNDLPDNKDSIVKVAAFFKAWAHFDPMAALRAAAKFKGAEAKTTSLQAVIESADTTQAESLAREISEWPADKLTQIQRQSVLSAAVTKWSQLNPMEAAKFFDSAALNAMSSHSTSWSIAQNWAAIDPQATIDWAQSHNDGRGYNSAMNGAIIGWWSKDHGAAESYVLRQGKSDPQLISSLSNYIASKDPERAKEWVSQLPDADQRRSADAMIATQLGFNDPKGASTWAATLPADVRERALTSAVNIWAANDLAGAGEWINSLAGAPRDEALGAYTSQLLRKDPATAAEWAVTISDQQIRERSLNRIASTWLTKDANAANAWIRASSLSDADKQRLRGLKPGGG